MTEENTLVLIQPDQAYDIFTKPGATDPILAKLREAAALAPTDVSTLKARKAIATFSAKFSKSKTFFESFGEELARDAKELPKKIDAARRAIKNTCDELRDATREPLDDWEKTEAARVNSYRTTISELESFANPHPTCLIGFLQSQLDGLSDLDPDACEEFADEIARAKKSAVFGLTESIAARKKAEDDRLELEELRRLKAERDAAEANAAAERAEIERQAASEKEASERARVAAETAVLAERARVEDQAKAAAEATDRRERELQAQAAESERKAAEAIRQAQETAARIDREAQAEKARELAETRKRAEDKEHAAKINRAIVAALIEACAFIDARLSEGAARAIVKQIALGNVPNVKISY